LKVQLSFEVFEEYLKINLSGENPFDEINEIILTIQRLLEENHREKLLVDVVYLGNPSEMEKFHIGELGADAFGSKIKAALISRPEYINKFMENVAVNRGGRVYVAGSEQAALRWLLKE
jgi:hypothetical protein